MNTKILEGYHATYLKKAESILQGGFEDSISDEKKLEWLGDGVYFWEEDYYAVQWNIISMEKEKKETQISDYAILKAVIKVNASRMIDISSPEGGVVFNRLKEELITKYEKDGREEIVKRLKNRSSKFWINVLEDGGFFKDFDVITAIYKNEKNIEKYKDDIVLNVQRQICVKNKDCIKSVKLYNQKERILNLYSIILKKRKDYYEKDKKDVKKS